MSEKQKLRQAAHSILRAAEKAPDKRISVPAKIIHFLAHGGAGRGSVRDAAERRAERLEVASRILPTYLGAIGWKGEHLPFGVITLTVRIADALIAEIDLGAEVE